MRVLLYEWCCSGGLGGAPKGEAFDSIAREGRMMLEALAADASKDPSLEVTVLVDATRPIDLPKGTHAVPVSEGHEVEMLLTAAHDAAWTLIVAPESDGILAERVRAVRSACRQVLGCDDVFIAIASDKQSTIQALAAAGVPVPAGRGMAAGETVPPGFRLPAVRKARDGAGCDGLTIIHDAAIAPSSRPSRLEAFVSGMPVGVSCLCGPSGIEPLPPMRQRFSQDASPRYLGSEILDDADLAARAAGLARRAVAAVMAAAGGIAAAGWVGVDMMLGGREDGRDDRVLEVNPRLTTSFVWLAPRSPSSLVRSMIDRADRSI
ncbi:MAG: ATP-grasp domain-containing protein [Planctomycetia bacterium]